MARTGRPQIQIDEEVFIGLCRIQCTLNEIAGFFKCSEDTVERWCKRTFKKTFAETYKIHSVNGRISLRRSQFKMAEHNVTMAIWLGKQYLGQTDKLEQTLDEQSEDILNEIADEIRKVKKEDAVNKERSSTVSA